MEAPFDSSYRKVGKRAQIGKGKVASTGLSEVIWREELSPSTIAEHWVVKQNGSLVPIFFLIDFSISSIKAHDLYFAFVVHVGMVVQLVR